MFTYIAFARSYFQLGKFTFPAKAASFFNSMTSEEDAELADETRSSSTSVAPEQEATPAKSSTVKD